MSATSHLFEAALGHATELHEAHALVHTTANCGSLEPRWWVVDIGVRARVLDTAAAPVLRPAAAEFRGDEFSSHSPLHVQVEASLLDGRTSSRRTWLIDASSTRAYLFASVINLTLLGPKSLEPYVPPGGLSGAAPRTVFAEILAGLWPCDTSRQLGIPGVPGRGSSCTLRVRVDGDLRVAIPPGARTLTIYDPKGGRSPWSWTLGDERLASIPVRDGQSDACPVPSCTHVAPAFPVAEDRDALLVFGVDL